MAPTLFLEADTSSVSYPEYVLESSGLGSCLGEGGLSAPRWPPTEPADLEGKAASSWWDLLPRTCCKVGFYWRATSCRRRKVSWIGLRGDKTQRDGETGGGHSEFWGSRDPARPARR